MHGYKLTGVLFALLAGACLLLTGWIMHLSGALQGATENGRWALGMAAIAVHLILAVCGLAMFVSRNLLVSLVCGAMMLGAAACSAWQIGSFLATEVISVTKAREAAEKRESARNAAVIEMAKERQRTQAELAKGHLKWVEGTVRSADGRRERKDSMEAGLKVISEMGKAEAPPLPELKTDAPPSQSGQVAQWVAARMGWDETAMQASPYLMIALMLLLIEVVGWPLSSYFWNRSTIPEIGPAVSPPAAPVPLPAALAAGTEPKALPAPVALQPADGGQPEPAKPIHPSKAPPPVQRPRQPIPGSVQALVGIGFPLTRPDGPQREKEPPKAAAYRFAIWAKAMGLHGEYSPGDLYTLYREFAEADHREPVAYNALAANLENRGNGISKTRPLGSDGRQAVVWVVTPGKFKPKTPAPKDEPERLGHMASKAEEGGVVTRPPFGVASSRATRPDGSDLAWLRQQEKAMRAMRIARNRKQRGSLTRRAA